jgi:hypothetical protein
VDDWLQNDELALLAIRPAKEMPETPAYRVRPRFVPNPRACAQCGQMAGKHTRGKDHMMRPIVDEVTLSSQEVFDWQGRLLGMANVCSTCDRYTSLATKDG